MKTKKLMLLSVLFVLGTSLLFPSLSQAEDPPPFVTKWGSFGSGNEEFTNPYDVAADSSGNVYVADSGNQRIQKFNSNGQYLATIGSFGYGDGEFRNPMGIAADSAGYIYVTDSTGRIQKFDSDGNHQATWGGAGSGDGQFNNPRGIAVDNDGNIYVADTSNHRIQKLDAAGNHQLTWGGYGSALGEFNTPWYLAVDNLGYVYVGDTYNHRIQKFDSNGVYQLTWGEWGYGAEAGDGQFSAPHGVAVDSSGDVFVVDRFNHRIQKFSPEGVFLTKWGTSGTGDGEFNNPIGISVDNLDNVYVVDHKNHRVQKFGSGNTPPEVSAGSNVAIATSGQASTILQGTVTDADNDSLTYRWLEDSFVLKDSAAVGAGGEAPLDLSSVPLLDIGEHTLTLKADDGTVTASDTMLLTINNSPPVVAPSGGGTFHLGDDIILSAEAADFDGDVLTYRWFEGPYEFDNGSISTIAGGDPVPLIDYYIYGGLPLGEHTITLEADDGINQAVSGDILVSVIDNEAPTLQPVAIPSILWPPNHKMVNVVIETNAQDNSGAVTLSASVTSSEPPDVDGDGNTIPDFTELAIDQVTGIITLQLRAERSGKGDGRTYTITITATDDSGNTSTATVEVIAPHDRGKKQ